MSLRPSRRQAAVAGLFLVAAASAASLAGSRPAEAPPHESILTVALPATEDATSPPRYWDVWQALNDSCQPMVEAGHPSQIIKNGTSYAMTVQSTSPVTDQDGVTEQKGDPSIRFYIALAGVPAASGLYKVLPPAYRKGACAVPMRPADGRIVSLNDPAFSP